jgi:hypothetical protein
MKKFWYWLRVRVGLFVRDVLGEHILPNEFRER